MVEQKNFQEILDYISSDHDKNRFIARVFFVNDITTYFSLVKELSDRAEIIIRISDDKFCKGNDTVPDLKAVIGFLDSNSDKNILLPHLAEYLRIGEVIERNSMCIHSILNRHVHSTARVWIPIFSAKSLFQSVVGHLDEERFGKCIFEVENPNVESSVFHAVAFSMVFAKQKGIINAEGLKEWFRLWDDNKVKSGMSFSTRQIKQISQSSGEYVLTVVKDPYTYLCKIMKEGSTIPKKELGTDEEWSSLIQCASEGDAIEKIILKKINAVTFDPHRILGNWNHNSDNEKWCFFVWYKLGLNSNTDYIAFALQRCEKYCDVQRSLIESIFYCTDNPMFDRWIEERREVFLYMGIKQLSGHFWDMYNLSNNVRTKLKILTGITHHEKTEIITLISQELKEGRKVNDFERILTDKYPDLLLYLQKPQHLKAELSDYIEQYKMKKIEDVFTLEFSELAGKINYLDYDSRGSILYSLKKDNPYFIWIDGMGVEWIDLFIKKVEQFDERLKNPMIKIGTATIPTVTSVNMEKADKETISEKKFDNLDSIGHIKDKSDCNYFSVIAKQFEMIETIAHRVCEAARNNPNRNIVVTSDHGMSRMAAKAFHETEGIKAPDDAKVFNHGRFCVVQGEMGTNKYINTVVEGNVIAYHTHNHFGISGNAPGETHGGVAPEEIFVPVIVFHKVESKLGDKYKKVNYHLKTQDIYLDEKGDAIAYINTDEAVESLTVEVNGAKYRAMTMDGLNWEVKINGLALDNDYELSICPNNLHMGKTEAVHVKRRGLVINDDF